MTNKMFIKDESVLREDHKVDDLLDFSGIVADFDVTLKKIEGSSMVRLVGKFGSGKSTMLYQLYNGKKDDPGEAWFVFDAWKYPDRKDLWEGFALDFANQVGIREKILNQIDGRSQASEIIDKVGGSVSGAIAVVASVYSWIPAALAFLIAPFTKEFLGGISGFFGRSPAIRVFQIQDILNRLIRKVGKDIYIIVEDIDRSGDGGIFFLETLRNFIKDNSFDCKVTVVVTTGNGPDEKSVNDAYRKIFDYKQTFALKGIRYRKFVEAVFSSELLDSNPACREQIEYLLDLVARERDSTIRDIKRFLRQAEIDFRKLSEEDRETMDARVFLLFTIARQLDESFVVSTGRGLKLRADFFGSRFLLMLAYGVSEADLMTKGYRTGDAIMFVKNGSSIPVSRNFSLDEPAFYLSDTYEKLF